MLPSTSDSRWVPLVMGTKQYQFRLLALKILMGRILASTRKDSSSENVLKCINDVRDFFLKNEVIAQHDINQIFG